MKKIAIVALAAAATFITSCDIERLPYDKYTEDKIMEDKDAAVDVLLNGCYAKLKKASEHLHYCGEFPGDNVCKDKPTTNPFGTYFTYQHTVNNGGLTTVWNSAYNIISHSQTETIFAVKFIASDWEDWGDPLGSMYAEIDGQGWGEVYASAKYMDLLHETGKGTDAREAFIHPQYKEDANGNQIPAFRFVANLYTDGKISGYVYRQGETKEVGGKLIATVDGEEYTLTPVDVDNKRYSISYKGETYEGDYDYFMLESQGNPKFYSYKCSKQDGYPHLYSPVISRLGELYLIRAEASAKLGNYTKALADLNTVRTRSLPNAGYKSLDATNAHELIMKERQLELAYEADRGFDVYRVGDTMKRHYPGFHDGVPEYPATSPLAIQYIPQSEINAYPGTLTQNP